MAALRKNPRLLAAGMVALASAGCVEASQSTAARHSAGPHPGNGSAADSKARPAGPRPRSDLLACANIVRPGKPALTATADARVADFARLLHGTWVRRLTFGGVLLETNSFLYFDMSGPEAGEGRALMIDRVNQGWDRLSSAAGTTARTSADGRSPESELEAPATTGAYWSVSIKPAPAEPFSKGHSGLTMALAGEYRGTAKEIPPGGFRFTETGTFYRDDTAYSTVRPWRAPPMAVEATQGAASADPAERFTPVDAVVVEIGNAGRAGNVSPAAGPIPSGSGESARPTLTYVMCQDQIVDRYYKVDSATPSVEGKSLKAAWDSAVASGMFRASAEP